MTVREFISSIGKSDDRLSIGFLNHEICSGEFYQFTNEADLTNLSVMAGNLKAMLTTDRFVYPFSRLADFEIEEGTTHVRSVEVEDVEEVYVKESYLLHKKPQKLITTYGITIKGCFSVAQLNYKVYCESIGQEYNDENFRYACECSSRW